MLTIKLKAPTKSDMMFALWKAGFMTEVMQASSDFTYVETIESDLHKTYELISASHNHSFIIPQTEVITPAVVAQDGTVVTPAVIDPNYFCTLHLRSKILETMATLTNYGVEVIDAPQQAFAGDPPTFQQLQREKLAKLGSIFRAKRDAGISIAGKKVATDPSAVLELSELVAYLTRVGGTQNFVTRNGDIFQNVDLATAQTIYNTVVDRQAALQNSEATIAATVLAALDIPALDAIDLTQGW